MQRWFEQTDGETRGAVSSRIRLVRNWEAYPFPSRLSDEDSLEMLKRLEQGLGDMKDRDGRQMVFSYLSELPELERKALRERRVLNACAAETKAPAALLLSADESEEVVLNSEDHIRIQVLSAGLHLEQLWQRADQIDDRINSCFRYAFDRKYGYLTSFPTNVGTGLRAAVVIHLPTLSMGRKFNSMIGEMSRFGASVRGVYGEGSENYGALYEVSNLKTLGLTEKEIIDLVNKVAGQLLSQERQVRTLSLNKHRLERTDEAYKSYGVLKYARRLAAKDAMTFLSQIMSGLADGLLETKTSCPVYRLMLGIQSANLQKLSDRPLSKEELDVARASYLRSELPELKES